MKKNNVQIKHKYLGYKKVKFQIKLLTMFYLDAERFWIKKSKGKKNGTKLTYTTH